MTGQLQDKVALVTGAGAGIGEAIARRFAEEGAKVVVAERDTRSGSDVARAIGGLFVPVDVSVRDQVESAVAQAVSAYGSIDVVVINAWGGGSIGRVENKTDQQLSDGIAVAYYGPFWAMRAALPHMRARGWGRVINVCSLNGVNAHMGTLEYNAAKEALRALTRTAAREWAPFGVTVNAICPAAKERGVHSRTGCQPGRRSVRRRDESDGPHRRSLPRHRPGRGVPGRRGLPLSHRQHVVRRWRQPHQRGGLDTRSRRRNLTDRYALARSCRSKRKVRLSRSGRVVRVTSTAPPGVTT